MLYIHRARGRIGNQLDSASSCLRLPASACLPPLACLRSPASARLPLTLEQRLDRGRDGEGLGVSVDETGDLQPEWQPFILQHGQRDRGDAEQ